jgi:protein gp37
LRGRFGYPKENPFEPTFHPDRLIEPYRCKKPAKIFTCCMGDVFGDWVSDEWIYPILKVIADNPQHIFQILSKNAKKLVRYHFPPNVWLGISIDSQSAVNGLKYLLESDAKMKFVSLEPLLEPVDIDLSGLQWIIIGGTTGRKRLIPDESWVKPIIAQARKLHIPIFLKDNLFWKETIREFPGVRA